jgi:S1-C subfamily serine protease
MQPHLRPKLRFVGDKNSGAEKSGLKKGDIIVKWMVKIATYADLSGYINTKRPMIKYR